MLTLVSKMSGAIVIGSSRMRDPVLPWVASPLRGGVNSLARVIVSGGQAGVDRAALDFAIEAEITHGGWCPKGRKAEDGTIPLIYRLTETSSSDYRQRTRANVRDSDATLVLNIGDLDGGSLLTVEAAKRPQKPCLVVQLDSTDSRESAELVNRWLAAGDYRVLNIAGPRECKRPGVYKAARAFLKLVESYVLADRQNRSA